MYQAIPHLLASYICLLLAGSIPYSIWLTRTAMRKQWRKFTIRLSIPLLILLLLFGLASLTQNQADREYYRDLFNASFEAPQSLYAYHSERTIQGDGYSIEIITLHPSVRHRFENFDEHTAKNFPKRPIYRRDWSTQNWRETPLSPQDQSAMNFALAGRNGATSSAHFEAFRQALSQSGNYYAYHFKGGRSSPSNIDFFVIDLHQGRIYMINLNT